jgi:hypothetical protein
MTIAAMILGGPLSQISYGQSEPDPAASSLSGSVTSPVQFDVVSVKMHSPDNRREPHAINARWSPLIESAIARLDYAVLEPRLERPDCRTS